MSTTTIEDDALALQGYVKSYPDFPLPGILFRCVLLLIYCFNHRVGNDSQRLRSTRAAHRPFTRRTLETRIRAAVLGVRAEPTLGSGIFCLFTTVPCPAKAVPINKNVNVEKIYFSTILFVIKILQ